MGSDRELSELFRESGEEYARQLACQLESGEENKFSPRFETAVQEMIARESARAAAPPKSPWRKQLRAACLLLVCLVGLGFGAMRVEAFRIPLLNLLVGEQEPGYTQVNFPSLEDNASFRGEVTDYLPTWTPKGYRLEGVDEDERFIHGVYANEAGGRILLSVTPNSGSSVMLDSQDSAVTQTEIGTRGAFVAKRAEDGRVVILMFDNAYAYTLTSYLAEEEALKVMKSIR